MKDIKILNDEINDLKENKKNIKEIEEMQNDMDILQNNPEFKARFIDIEGKKPANFYNGMIYPLAPFAIKGVIWYQGESSKQDYDIYDRLHSELIKGWRKLWGQGDFPFQVLFR